MQNNPENSLRIGSFLNGLTIPFVGMVGVNRQIDVQTANSGRGSELGYFALGHMLTATILIVGISIAVYCY